MNVTLSRFAYLPTVTLGWLHVGAVRLATLERPWIANLEGPGGSPFESCVPDGEYALLPHTSRSFPETYVLVNEVLGVYQHARPSGQRWGRDGILIHIGNFVTDVIGCIVVGTRHGGAASVTDSRIAMGRLRELLGRENHSLNIRPQGTQESTS